MSCCNLVECLINGRLCSIFTCSHNRLDMFMLKKTFTIIFFLCLAAALFVAYDSLKLPDDIEVKGDPKETLAWLALGTSIVSLLTSLVGLFQKLVEKNNNEK